MSDTSQWRRKTTVHQLHVRRPKFTEFNHTLVVRGHSHWDEPLAELKSGTQVLNVDARVVVLTENKNLNRIIVAYPPSDRYAKDRPIPGGVDIKMATAVPDARANTAPIHSLPSVVGSLLCCRADSFSHFRSFCTASGGAGG